MELYLVMASVGLLTALGWRSDRFLSAWILEPYEVVHHRKWWSLLTHGFLHADFTHLLFNGISLYVAGEAVLMVFKALFGDMGGAWFVLFFVSAIPVSALPSLLKHKNNPNYRALGASGAVAAVLMVFVMFFPKVSLMMFFLPIPIPAWLFGLIYLATEFALSKRGGTGIAHDAHFMGSIYGILISIWIDPSVLSRFISEVIG